MSIPWLGKNTNLARFWQTFLQDLASESINLADFLQESCKICVILQNSCKISVILQESCKVQIFFRVLEAAPPQDILAIETVIPFKTENRSMLKNFLFCLKLIRYS